MKAKDNGAFYSITANGNDIDAFTSRWPCHGFGSIARVWAEFDRRSGDLVDLQHKQMDSLDYYAMSCFVGDMQEEAKKQLNIKA